MPGTPTQPITAPPSGILSAPGAPPRGRRPAPPRSPYFDHLALDELRAYRTELSEEETRVSYWRRVLQARIDIVSAGARTVVDRRRLQRLLSSERVNAGRTALIQVMPADGLPPLPQLGRLWEQDPVAGDEAGNAELVAQLVAAERQLSAYRQSLHRRIDAATDELVARYRERPSLAVRALPLQAPVRPRPAGY